MQLLGKKGTEIMMKHVMGVYLRSIWVAQPCEESPSVEMAVSAQLLTWRSLAISDSGRYHQISCLKAS